MSNKITPKVKRRLERQGRAKSRAINRIAKRYGREIQKLLSDWLHDWLMQLSETSGVKFRADSMAIKGGSGDLFECLSVRFNSDALSDDLGPLFDAAIADLGQRVDRFVIRIKKRANGIAALRHLDFKKDKSNFVELGIDPTLTEPWLIDEIQDHAAINARLIKKVGVEVMAEVEAVAYSAMKVPISTPNLAKKIGKISKKFNVNRAKLIARDQIAKLQQNITKIRATRAGASKYYWQTSDDERVRSKHEALDGSIREYGKGIEPGEEVNCRCVGIVVFDDELE